MSNLHQEIGPLALAYGLIAAPLVPLLFVLRRFAAPSGPPRRDFRPGTVEVTAWTLLALVLPKFHHDLLSAAARQGILHLSDSSSVALSAVSASLIWTLLFSLWLQFLRIPRVNPLPVPRLTGDAAAGIAGFLVLTPVTFGVYFLINAVLDFFGGQPDDHPLTKFDSASPLSIGLLIVGACLAAPLLEEFVFRGLLLPWAHGRRHRPWILFAFAVVTLLMARDIEHLGTIALLMDLTVLMALASFGREIWRKWPSRTASSIFATAALFGCIHAAVWPTPYPLTVLAIGLGILSVRRGSARPAIVAHALFNAVSVVFLLRRGA